MKNISLFIGLWALTLLAQSCSNASDGSANAPNNTTGKGGSMARFAINGDYLYTVDGSSLRVFDLAQPDQPRYQNIVPLGRGIETIFPYQNHLFIGTETGMLIYGLDSRQQPFFKSSLVHVRACDPVVAQGNYAYVTLRGGNMCGGTANQLDVVDISNLAAPRLLKSIPMTGPYGVGVDGRHLFVCDGNTGLRVLTIDDPANPVPHTIFGGVHAYDVIPLNGLLMMIGNDGLYQYSYVNTTLTQLSKLPVGQ